MQIAPAGGQEVRICPILDFGLRIANFWSEIHNPESEFESFCNPNSEIRIWKHGS